MATDHLDGVVRRMLAGGKSGAAVTGTIVDRAVALAAAAHPELDELDLERLRRRAAERVFAKIRSVRLDVDDGGGGGHARRPFG
jgi:hypothetical protein